MIFYRIILSIGCIMLSFIDKVLTFSFDFKIGLFQGYAIRDWRSLVSCSINRLYIVYGRLNAMFIVFTLRFLFSSLRWVFPQRVTQTWEEFCGQILMPGVELMQKQCSFVKKESSCSIGKESF